MSITTNRDYHLAKFRVAKFLERGSDILSENERTELDALIRQLRGYERDNGVQSHNPALEYLVGEYLRSKGGL